MNYDILVEQFCTPPYREETSFDKRAFDEKSSFDIEFEDRTLKAYSIGEGPNVLLAHGWGSRASHMVLIARFIASNGYRVVVYDAPAHGRSKIVGQKDLSNMFEFGKALSCVANYIGDIYAVIGHSLGAITAAFTITGTGIFKQYKFPVEKLVLISSPVFVEQVFENYSIGRDELHLLPELRIALETAFNFKASEYDLLLSLQNLDSKLLLIHDEKDEEVPVSDTLLLKNKLDNLNLKLTSGYGHQKILVNRAMLGFIKEFLTQ